MNTAYFLVELMDVSAETNLYIALKNMSSSQTNLTGVQRQYVQLKKQKKTSVFESLVS